MVCYLVLLMHASLNIIVLLFTNHEKERQIQDVQDEHTFLLTNHTLSFTALCISFYYLFFAYKMSVCTVQYTAQKKHYPPGNHHASHF